MHRTSIFLAIHALALSLAACSEMTRLPPNSDVGPRPALPDPPTIHVRTVNIPPVAGWPAGTRPLASAGFAVNAFAPGLDHPRWLHVLPNGDVLVAETNRPAAPDGGGFGPAPSNAAPSADRITLLRDADGDGIAETRSVLLDKLHSPFGMALVGNELYVANTDALLRFPYRNGDMRIREAGVKVAELPAGPDNRHWTRNVIAARDGSRLYVTVGSASNIGENGTDKEINRAAILEIDPATGEVRVFASGLRNPNGLGWQPDTGALWTTVNERDELGSDLVPDYMTSVRKGGFYGWPYSYFGQIIDDRPKQTRMDLVLQALTPDYALGAHTSPLGLAFYEGSLFPARYAGGAFIAQHGSWNRRPLSGYKVIFVPFVDGHPSGLPEDVLTGFISGDGKALGRPTGVAVDRGGALLVADDAGNTVWRVTPASPGTYSPGTY